MCIEPVMNDVDGDNHPEIFGTSSASGNYDRTMPYSDSSSWLMVFDDKLRFEFPPVEFPGFANALNTFPYKNEKFRGYVLYHMVNGADTTVPRSRLMIYSNMGKLVRSRLLDSHQYPNYDQVFIIKSLPSDRIYLLADRFLELNDKLEVIRSVALPFAKPVSPYQIDINGDGTDEFLLYSESEKRLFYIARIKNTY
ncbi:MAG: hypothetical protein IPJ37_22670 [Bacteroidales bacterium]|nr:hypothetical protein [Bacteroidales bacterium]